MRGTIIKRDGMVETVLSIADCGLSGELNFAVYRGCARGVGGRDGRRTT